MRCALIGIPGFCILYSILLPGYVYIVGAHLRWKQKVNLNLNLNVWNQYLWGNNHLKRCCNEMTRAIRISGISLTITATSVCDKMHPLNQIAHNIWFICCAFTLRYEYFFIIGSVNIFSFFHEKHWITHKRNKNSITSSTIRMLWRIFRANCMMQIKMSSFDILHHFTTSLFPCQ